MTIFLASEKWWPARAAVVNQRLTTATRHCCTGFASLSLLIATGAAVSLAAAASFVTYQWQANKYERRLSDLRTQYATAQHQALEKAHAQTIRLQATADTAARAAAARASTLAHAVAAVRTERDGLRDDLAAVAPAVCLPGNTGPATVDHTAAIAELLGQCADRLSDMAGKAQGHADDAVTLLEAWPVQLKVTLEMD